MFVSSIVVIAVQFTSSLVSAVPFNAGMCLELTDDSFVEYDAGCADKTLPPADAKHVPITFYSDDACQAIASHTDDTSAVVGECTAVTPFLGFKAWAVNGSYFDSYFPGATECKRTGLVASHKTQCNTCVPIISDLSHYTQFYDGVSLGDIYPHRKRSEDSKYGAGFWETWNGVDGTSWGNGGGNWPPHKRSDSSSKGSFIISC